MTDDPFLCAMIRHKQLLDEEISFLFEQISEKQSRLYKANAERQEYVAAISKMRAKLGIA